MEIIPGQTVYTQIRLLPDRQVWANSVYPDQTAPRPTGLGKQCIPRSDGSQIDRSGQTVYTQVRLLPESRSGQTVYTQIRLLLKSVEQMRVFGDNFD